MQRITILVCLLLLLQGFARADAPTTQPSKRAAERAEKLKASTQTFSFVLNYHGEQAKPYYRLTVSVPAIMTFRHDPFDMHPQITEDQAKKIIDYLAREGFLDHATAADPTRSPPPPPEPSYSMSVQADGKAGPLFFDECLGWDRKMLQRLDGLRTVLEGDAAKSMDLLLGRLAGHRKEWEKPAATQPAPQTGQVTEAQASELAARFADKAGYGKTISVIQHGEDYWVAFETPPEEISRKGQRTVIVNAATGQCRFMKRE